MKEEDLLATLGFSLTGVIGPINFGRIVQKFGSADRAWKQSEKVLLEIGLTERMVAGIASVKNSVPLSQKYQELEAQGVSLLSLWDDSYPLSLRSMRDAPYLLYTLGEILPEDQKAVAIVGSRRQTVYGREVIRNLVPDLVSSGLTIVSGLAMGNDTAAHLAALETGGRTLGVLGSGILRVHPLSSMPIAQRIVKEKRGAVISEFPPEMEPFPYNFPVRNRIISGLSLGVIVIEADEKSGTLSTASHALEQGREVFAVPGDIRNPLSRGPHHLIDMGAKVVTSAESILMGLGLPTSPVKSPSLTGYTPQSLEEEVLIKLLRMGEQHVDDLIRESGLQVPLVLSTLSLLQLRGVVADQGGGFYRSL